MDQLKQDSMLHPMKAGENLLFFSFFARIFCKHGQKNKLSVVLACLRIFTYNDCQNNPWCNGGANKKIKIANERIREVLRIVGIDRMVTIIDPLTGKEDKKPICEVAASHMARRTFSRYREIDKGIKTNVVKLLDD